MTRLLIYILFTMMMLSKNSMQAQNNSVYDVFIPIPHEEFIVAKMDSNNQLKYGVTDIRGKILVPLEYDKIQMTGDSITRIRNIYKWLKHVEMQMTGNLLTAKKNNKWGGYPPQCE